MNNPTWVSGKLNSALSFNGVNAYVSVPWGTLSGNAARTIALWFKTTSTANSNWVSWGTNASTQLSQVGIYSGGLGYLGYANDLTVPAASYANGNWHYLAVTFDGNHMILYLDGVQVNTETTTLATGTSQLNIGRAITASNYYNGVLDEVRIYNEALSASQVNKVYTLS